MVEKMSASALRILCIFLCAFYHAVYAQFITDDRIDNPFIRPWLFNAGTDYSPLSHWSHISMPALAAGHSPLSQTAMTAFPAGYNNPLSPAVMPAFPGGHSPLSQTPIPLHYMQVVDF